MAEERKMTRRQVIGLGAATLATSSLPDLLLGPAHAAGSTGGTLAGASYFGRFGVDERLIREALGEALLHGGDHADLFFQHRVANSYVLEDGAVSRALTQVELGVGVRVVRGDQTGYGFTEDLTPEGVKLAARTAAAIADGPARPAPPRFRTTPDVPSRYPVKVRWETCGPSRSCRSWPGSTRRPFRPIPG
jgi:TldD protein